MVEEKKSGYPAPDSVQSPKNATMASGSYREAVYRGNAQDIASSLLKEHLSRQFIVNSSVISADEIQARKLRSGRSSPQGG